MNNYFILAVSVFFDLLACGILRNSFCKNRVKSNSDLHVFNILSSVVTLAVMFIAYAIAGMLCVPSFFTVGIGLIYGVATALCAIFNMKALECGPLSYTKVIICCAMVIPALSGTVFFNETIGFVQYIGIALMLLSFILAVEKDKDGGKANIKWFVYSVLAFLFNGSLGVFQKLHQTSEYKDEIGMYQLAAFTVSALLSLVLLLIYRKKETIGVTLFERGKILSFLIITLVCGCGIAFCNHFNMYLSGVMPAIVVFPVLNGGTMILTTASGLIIWKERLSPKQIVGLAAGILAILLLCFAEPIQQLFS